MQNVTASWTAIYTSIARAAHQVLDQHPKVVDDPVVVGLVEGSSAAQIQARADDFQGPVQCLARALFVMRNRLAEDELHRAVAAGAGQYLMLGAGLDTFAYRQPDWARGIRLIEVDHPASQACKRDYLHAARIGIPRNLSFCAMDFERMTLRQGLETVGFDPQVPTFLSWLGVTQYLERAAIQRTLEDVLALPVGSGLVMSFIIKDPGLDGLDQEAVQVFSSLAAARGEPWISRFDPGQLQHWLLELGFAEALLVAPAELEQRYFAGRTDRLRAPVFEQLVIARV
ncbi:SAM-dependent methyltransferase [Pseudomonas sp. CMR5c]|uniref:class I SAM-dependent methyltransferase n=1 Tax=Pseudomonas sp. CMR5c TaxID=658630 RepID=UPI00069EC341|nr:SAM-dependent methyltransferase [Pseudomonas sp. CMR5c]AZC18430.1 O-Methyltransferase [Pseudomonas sp. CMR5c]